MFTTILVKSLPHVQSLRSHIYSPLHHQEMRLELSKQMEQEQQRLQKMLEDLEPRRRALDEEEEGIRKQLVAIEAYVNALQGKLPTTRGKKQTRGPRKTGIKQQVLDLITQNPSGISRTQLLENMGAKGDKSLEGSIGNTLNALKKEQKIMSGERGTYLPFAETKKGKKTEATS